MLVKLQYEFCRIKIERSNTESWRHGHIQHTQLTWSQSPWCPSALGPASWQAHHWGSTGQELLAFYFKLEQNMMLVTFLFPFKLNKILIMLFFPVIWDVHLSEYSTQREQCKLLTSIIYTSMVNTVPVSRDHIYFIFYKMTLVKIITSVQSFISIWFK